jgi:hypothetical protein
MNEGAIVAASALCSLAGLTAMVNSEALTGKRVVLTGKFKRGARKDLETALKQHGATTGSRVSAKTDLLIAGAAAGSKLYDAHRLGVPILAEGHLELLLAGEPLAAVVELARTFYTLADPGDPAPGDHNQIGGPAPGVAARRWPTIGGQAMDHLFTLDLATMPALAAHYPGQRTVSVFCAAAHATTMYDLGRPKNGLTAVVFTTQAQLDEPSAPPALARPPRPARRFRPVAHAWAELEQYFGRTRVLGAVPSWCQREEHQGNFIMQCGEDLTVSGDGLVYVFDDVVFAQFT